MIGLDSLANLSRLLSLAKEDWADSSHPFGGKNIIFFGDILQYKPVMDTAIYVNVLGSIDKSSNLKDIVKEYITMQNENLESSKKLIEEKQKKNSYKNADNKNKIPKINNVSGRILK